MIKEPTIKTYNEVKDLFSLKKDYISESNEWYPKGIKTNLLFMFPQMVAAGSGVASVFEDGHKQTVAVYNNKYMEASYDDRDFTRIRNLLAEKKNILIWAKNYVNSFSKASNKFYDYVKLIINTNSFEDFKRFENLNSFKDVFIELLDLGMKPQFYGYITEVFSFSGNHSWADNIILQYEPGLSEKERDILTLPGTKTFVQEYSEYIQNHNISEIKENWFWVKSSYYKISELTAEMIKLDKKNISKIELVDKTNILKKVSSKTREFVEFIELFIDMQDVRKSNVLKLNYALDHMMKFLSKKLGLKYDLLVDCTPKEIINLIEGLEVDFEFIKKRNKQSAWIFAHEGYIISTNKKDISFLTKLFNQNQINVTGFCASKGVVTGRVKVVLSEDDFSKFNDGDVLVTSMTRPEFVPLMSKASAIVTNEGGVTCHAAIIAREIKKPCIIGTKNATKVLNDGDNVEVDADKGVVKIL